MIGARFETAEGLAMLVERRIVHEQGPVDDDPGLVDGGTARR